MNENKIKWLTMNESERKIKAEGRWMYVNGRKIFGNTKNSEHEEICNSAGIKRNIGYIRIYYTQRLDSTS